MKKQRIDEDVLNRIQFRLIDKIGDYNKSQCAGFTKQAEETRHYIHGMISVLTELGYDVEVTETDKVIIVNL